MKAVDQRLDAVGCPERDVLSRPAKLRRQFEQEARLLAHLHHPALPRVSDYFTEGDRAFLVMQFISALTWLRSFPNSRGRSRVTR